MNKDIAYTGAACRELDRVAIEQHGINGFELMTRAARGAFNELGRRWPEARSISVACGKGNNAGDGYVVAGLAREAGYDVQLVQVDPQPLTGDAALAVEFAVERGINAEVPDGLQTGGPGFRGEVVVDALLGTGFRGDLRDPYPQAVAAINTCAQAGRGVLAVDIPTGVHADTGQVPGAAVRADVTVSFIGRKIGLHTGPGLDYCGETVHLELGVPGAVFQSVDGVPLLRFGAHLLPGRSVNAYKQGVGHLVIAGGDRGMAGAAVLAGEAALRTGTGLVSLLTHAEHAGAVIARRPELMVQDAGDDAGVDALLDRASAIVVGPGLGQQAWGRRLFARMAECGLPTLVDADGLRLLAERPDLFAQVLITPHAGEAAGLLGCSNREVNGDRPAAALALAGQVGGVAVLKGAGSVLAAPGELLGIVQHGNPGMATAGMGDVLSGVAGGWLAQGLPPPDAAILGATLHSAAGDAAARQLGERSLLAGDVTVAMVNLLRDADC